MELDYILGKMEESIKDNIIWIKRMVMEYIDGLMEEYTMVIGKMENSMGMENIFYQMEQ